MFFLTVSTVNMNKTKQKVLILYYSRTGITRTLSEAIQRRIGGEIVEIKTEAYRPGWRGYLQAALDATLNRIVPIRMDQPLESSYDLLLIGTPVWNASLSSPIHTLMSHSMPRAKQVAFFVTHGGTGSQRVFDQMETLYRKKPLATLEVTTPEMVKRRFGSKLEQFLQKLQPSKKEIQKAAA
jgi:flavodoxin